MRNVEWVKSIGNTVEYRCGVPCAYKELIYYMSALCYNSIRNDIEGDYFKCDEEMYRRCINRKLVK